MNPHFRTFFILSFRDVVRKNFLYTVRGWKSMNILLLTVYPKIDPTKRQISCDRFALKFLIYSEALPSYSGSWNWQFKNWNCQLKGFFCLYNVTFFNFDGRLWPLFAFQHSFQLVALVNHVCGTQKKVSFGPGTPG